MTFDLEVTLTFDLPIIQLHVMNAHTLNYIHTMFGKIGVDSLHNTDGQARDKPLHLPIVLPDKTGNSN